MDESNTPQQTTPDISPEPTPSPAPAPAPGPTTENAPAQPPSTPKKSKGKSRLVLIVVVLLLIAAGVGGYLYYKNRNSTPKPTAYTPAKTSAIQNYATVDVSSTGFTPATMQVKTGTQITWTNSTTSLVRIKSGPYPVGTDIKELDSVEPLNNGDSYSFVFEKAGTYHYVNWNNPKVNGTIIVQ